MSSIRFQIVDELITSTKKSVEKSNPARTSFSRLIKNSEHIKQLFSTSLELKKIRFNELDLLKDIREIVDSNRSMFENVNDPVQFRRQVRSIVLPRFIDKNFVQMTQRKILSEFLKSTSHQKNQDALMTALVFLQSHIDLGVPCEDNPLWEIVFNLSIKDGIRFVDSLTALIEGLDTIRDNEPDLISKDPLILQLTKIISTWNIYWRQLIEQEDIKPHESLISAMLRGELAINLYFDEIIHLLLFLFRLFEDKKLLNDAELDNFNEEEQTILAKDIFKQIRESVIKDLPRLMPVLINRLGNAMKLADKNNRPEQAEQLAELINALKKDSMPSENPFLFALLMTKISNPKYWDNKRDFFFFLTILKNPEEPQNYYTYSQILDKLKSPEAVEGVLKCAVELKENDFWGYWGLGNHYMKKNELEKSEKFLIQALKGAQQLEIYSADNYERELFLIKEDIQQLNKKKIKKEADTHQQIDLF